MISRLNMRSAWMAVVVLSVIPFTPGQALAATRAQVATDAGGNLVRVDGSIVLVEPDSELSLVTAGGLQEPRREWSETARRLCPAQVRAQLAGRTVELKPDYDLADDLDPASHWAGSSG